MDDPTRIIHTMYALEGWVARPGGSGRQTVWYSQGISPLFLRLGELRGLRITATDATTYGEMKSRDITSRFLLVQRLCRRWIMKQQILRSSGWVRRLLQRPATGERLDWLLEYRLETAERLRRQRRSQ